MILKKFAVEITKGNTETVIAVRNTREEAEAFAEEYVKTMSKDQGLLTLFSGEFDENDQRIDMNERILRIWR